MAPAAVGGGRARAPSPRLAWPPGTGTPERLPSQGQPSTRQQLGEWDPSHQGAVMRAHPGRGFAPLPPAVPLRPLPVPRAQATRLPREAVPPREGQGGGCRSRACCLTRPRPGAAGRMASWRWPTGDSDGTAGVTARGWVRPETQCVLQTGARAGTRAAGRVAPGACEWLSPHPLDGVCPGHTRPKSRQATPGSPGTDPRPEDTQWRWPRRMARWRCAAQAACRRTLSSPGGCPQRQGTQHFGGQCLGHKTSERLWRPASPEGKVPAQRQMRAF